MERNLDDDKIISALQEIGLKFEESLIYRTLVKYGQKGTTVRTLLGDITIKRTTIYSILQRLTEQGIIFEKKTSETNSMAKYFSCLEPSKLYDQIISKKKEKLKKIEEEQIIFTKTLQDEYLNKKNVLFEDLDPFIQPYFKTLLEKKWIISSQLTEKTFSCDIYEYHVNTPKISRFLPYRVFDVYVFDENIIKNITLKENFDLNATVVPDNSSFLQEYLKNNTMNYMIYFFLKRMEKRIPYDDMLRRNDRYKSLKIQEGKIELFGKTYTSIVFEKIEFIRSVFFLIRNKIYFLWAEKIEILKEMFENVLKVENLLPI